MQPLQAGDPEWIGDYVLLARLGAGGMGQVFLGQSPAGRNVAIKVVHEAFGGDSDFRARFRREVAAARAVSGAFTAPVIDADPEAAAPWLVTSFLPGLSLEQAVDAYGPLPPAAVRTLGASLAEALVSIHGAGIVHRDLKPSNVLLTGDGPRVIDFGVARAAEVSAVTQTGHIVGSAGFMAPEQATGGDADPASDVFSLGAVLTFAATGTGPFGRGAIHTLIYRILHEAPRLDGIADLELRELIASCLDRDPAARPTPETLRQRPALPAAIGTDDGGEADDSPSGGGRSAHGVAWLPRPPAEEVARCAAQAPPPGTVPWRMTPTPASAPVPQAPGPQAPVPYGPGPYPPGAFPQQPYPPSRFPPGGPYGPGQFHPDPYGQTTAADRPARSPHPSRRAVLAAMAVGIGGLAAAGGGGFLYARSRSGPLVWHTKLPSTPNKGVVVADGTVYATVTGGGLHAMDARTGKVRWQAGVQTGITRLLLTISNGVGLAQNTNSLEAFDTASGRTLWTKPFDNNIPLPLPAAGAGIVYATGRTSSTTFDEAVVALDARTGAERWRRTPEGDVWCNPVLSGGLVFVGARGGFVYAMSAADGALRWRQKAGGDTLNGVVSTPVVANGSVYVTTEQFEVCALDAATGRVRWKRSVPGGNNRSGAMPVVTGDTVYVGGEATLFALDAANGNIRWTYQVGGASSGENSVNPAWLTPTIVGSALLLYDGHKGLHGLDAATGREQWRQEANAHTDERPILAAGVAHIATLDGIMSFDPRTGRPLRTYDGEEDTSFFTYALTTVDEILYFAETFSGIYAIRPPSR